LLPAGRKIDLSVNSQLADILLISRSAATPPLGARKDSGAGGCDRHHWNWRPLLPSIVLGSHIATRLPDRVNHEHGGSMGKGLDQQVHS
jgi:hypothetical protein